MKKHCSFQLITLCIILFAGTHTFAQESDDPSMCGSLNQIIAGFENQFDGLYDPATKNDEYQYQIEWESTVKLPDFYEGSINKSTTNGKYFVYYDGEFEREDWDNGPYDALILTCLRLNGFALVGANTEEDEASDIIIIEYLLERDDLEADIITEASDYVYIELHIREKRE